MSDSPLLIRKAPRPSSPPGAVPYVSGTPPFHLVLTNQSTGLRIYIPGVGYLPGPDSLWESVNLADTYQFGFLYWKTGTVNYWRYIVNGLLSDETVSYDGDLLVNINALANTRDSAYATMEGYYDEVLFWKAGNRLTDQDILDIYNSYYRLDLHAQGFDAFVSSAAHVTCVAPLEDNCDPAESVWCVAQAASLVPCLEAESPVGCLSADSPTPEEATSCVCS